MTKIIIRGEPRTKKNSQQVVMCGRYPKILPSKAFRQYEKDALWQLMTVRETYNEPVEVTCKYYMKTARRVDLTNLMEATDDILVKAGVLADDNSKIIVSHDGSRVTKDALDPRVEITIRRYEDEQR